MTVKKEGSDRCFNLKGVVPLFGSSISPFKLKNLSVNVLVAAGSFKTICLPSFRISSFEEFCLLP